MAIIQLIDLQRQANIVQDINNVYYYESDAEPNSNDNMQELNIEWIQTVLPAITLIQVDQIVHLEVSSLVVNGLYFATEALGSDDGQIVGTAKEPYIAWEFIYDRATRLTRNGYKRIAGVTEEATDQAGNVDPSVLANLNALGVVLEAPIVLSWATLTPVIYGRPTPPPPAGSGLPERVNNVTGVRFVRVTTQNTRKSWR